MDEGSQQSANMHVRIKLDPTRIGILTGRPPRMRGNRELLQVRFADGDRWVPKNQIEFVTEFQLSPLDMLERGQLGRPIDLRRTLTHAKINGRLADVIYSMEATNTDFYAYQFKPVLKILESPSNGLLIADEVGLGKTIEAGLIWTELRSRFDMRRLVILCPAALREKWEYELAAKMGVRAQICDAKQAYKTLSSLDAQAEGFAIICSLQGLRPPNSWEDEEDQSWAAKLARFLRDNEHDNWLLDLLIIDEAHHLRNQATQTNELGQLFKPVSEYAVFLTATPIHNRNDDLYSLLNLLDPDTFTRMDVLTQILHANAPLIKARDALLRNDPNISDFQHLLKDASNYELLRDNKQLQNIRNSLSKTNFIENHEKRSALAYRLEKVNLLGHVVTRTRKREVKEWRVLREPVPELVPMLDPVEKDFYNLVTDTVLEYAEQCNVNELFLLAQPQRQMTSSMAAALHTWQTTGEFLDESSLAGELTETRAEIGPLVYDIIHKTSQIDLQLLEKSDSKYVRLSKLLTGFFKEFPKEKVVLFSSFRGTLKYLARRLEGEGIQTVVLMGGQHLSKEETINQFRKASGSTVLLTSEVGGEGVDMQFCRVLINYDLPWNPMRLEQRIGRLDRLGQTAEKIQIWNIMYEGTIDARIYVKLYQKLELIREALGDFESILGDKIRKLTAELLSGRLSPEEQEMRIEQTAQALENIRLEERHLEQGASSLIAYGDYILKQINDTKSMKRWISGNDIKNYVCDYVNMNYSGSDIIRVDKESEFYEIQLSTEAKYDLEEFVRQQKSSMTTRLTGMSNKPYLCRFDNRVTAFVSSNEEVISQFHPLVRMINQKLSKSEEQLTPAIAAKISISDGLAVEPGIYIIAIERWSFRALQDVDKLAFAGIKLNGGEEPISTESAELLISTAIAEGRDWLEAPKEVELSRVFELANDVLFFNLLTEYEEYLEELKAKNEDRAHIQLQMLQQHLLLQEAKLGDIFAKHIQEGRESLGKATKGRIDKLYNRVDQQRMRIEQRKQLRSDHEETALAIIAVQE